MLTTHSHILVKFEKFEHISSLGMLYKVGELFVACELVLFQLPSSFGRVRVYASDR